jgi:hypothetical protein
VVVANIIKPSASIIHDKINDSLDMASIIKSRVSIINNKINDPLDMAIIIKSGFIINNYQFFSSSSWPNNMVIGSF